MSSDTTSYYPNHLRYGIVIAVVVVMLTITLTIAITARLNVGDEQRSVRDRIAACVQSNDVVGCLEAATR